MVKLEKTDSAISTTLHLHVKMLPQPDETTCGPTCLQAVYRYWGDEEALDKIVDRIGRIELGGTFAVFLACDALRKGYRATIYTYNLNVFDPSWFGSAGIGIAERLQQQAKVKLDYRLRHATKGYLEFLKLGGHRHDWPLNIARVKVVTADVKAIEDMQSEKLIDSEAGLHTQADKLLKNSELILAQEYLPTEFDWRVGILDGRPLFACKYHMAPGHWQIIKHEERGITEGKAEVMAVFRKRIEARKGAVSL